MKNERHKRKESFSVLLISNMGRSSKQFHITLFALRLIFFILLFICVAAGWLTYEFVVNHRVQSTLREQIATQEDTVRQLTKEKEALDGEKLALSEENETLKQEGARKAEEEAAAAAAAEQEAAEQEPEDNSSTPTRYPFSGASVLKSNYSDEQPYLSVNTYADCAVIAAGSGTVVSVRSDDTYPHIIEIQHESGHLTRYMCHGEAQVETEEGAEVQIGDTLFTVTADETPVDYQIIVDEAPVDPLSIIDAKG